MMLSRLLGSSRRRALTLSLLVSAAMWGCMAEALEISASDVPINFSNAYGAFAVKWVTDVSAQNKVSQAANANAAKAQQKIQAAVQRLAKKLNPDNVEKFKSQVNKLLGKGSAQGSALVWVATIETAALTPSLGMTGTISVGDSTSGGLTRDFTLSQQYSATAEGYAVSAYYSAPPESAESFTFNALVLSDELTAAAPTGIVVGLWVCVIVDPNLIAALGGSNVTNTSTATEGLGVTVPVALAISGSRAHSGSSSFGATYFSIQDLFGVGVPPEAVTWAQATIEKLRSKLAKYAQ